MPTSAKIRYLWRLVFPVLKAPLVLLHRKYESPEGWNKFWPFYFLISALILSLRCYQVQNFFHPLGPQKIAAQNPLRKCRFEQQFFLKKLHTVLKRFHAGGRLHWNSQSVSLGGLTEINEKTVEKRERNWGKERERLFYLAATLCKIWLSWVQGKKERLRLLEKMTCRLTITVTATNMLAQLLLSKFALVFKQRKVHDPCSWSDEPFDLTSWLICQI